jgi:hypothetical protein
MINGCRNESQRTCDNDHEAECFGMWRSEADVEPMAKLRESTMARDQQKFVEKTCRFTKRHIPYISPAGVVA